MPGNYRNSSIEPSQDQQQKKIRENYGKNHENLSRQSWAARSKREEKIIQKHVGKNRKERQSGHRIDQRGRSRGLRWSEELAKYCSHWLSLMVYSLKCLTVKVLKCSHNLAY